MSLLKEHNQEEQKKDAATTRDEDPHQLIFVIPAPRARLNRFGGGARRLLCCAGASVFATTGTIA